MPTKTHVCRRCGDRHGSMTGLCKFCRPARQGKRPERSCTGCGTVTTAQNGLCRRCTIPTYASPICAARSFDRLAIPGGTWHPVRGVWRWIPWDRDERTAA